MADHVCPVWVGYLLASPLRKLFDNPRKRLSPYISRGMTVIDVGCAMGFFSLPMAEMVGPDGRVICIDLQEKMVQKLYRKAKKKNLLNSIEARVCRHDSLNVDDLDNAADFVLAAAVVHEVQDAASFLAELYGVIKDGGKLLVVEPGGHVSEKDFRATVNTAVKCGFTLLDSSGTRRRRKALFQKIPEK
ncbi:MAG: class I SAM-dependent methyltransferase [Candidatus Aegiribacteria sp.]|nr:class I SAM-dependent methyltransferase [Candidatus Aegiribacteria sp.]